jgi:hypothetical protein
MRWSFRWESPRPIVDEVAYCACGGAPDGEVIPIRMADTGQSFTGSWPRAASPAPDISRNDHIAVPGQGRFASWIKPCRLVLGSLFKAQNPPGR